MFLNYGDVMKGSKSLRRIVVLIFLPGFFSLFICCQASFAIAEQSSVSISIESGTLSVELMPSISGSFDDSGDATVSVSTNNFTGYNLSINTDGGTSLSNSNNDEILSVLTETTEQAFSTSSSYNNMWGFKPSQYIMSNNGIDSVVNNSNYLPAPSGDGLMLAKTSTANAENTVDSYSYSFGVRIDNTLPAGIYDRTYVLTAVANSIVYNVTYDENTGGTTHAGSMPSPNPQALEIDGGTPVTDSYAPLNNAVPTLADKTFGGWCDVRPTRDSLTQNDECSGTTYAAGADYPIDQTADGTNITLYAIWITDPFPTVWSQMGKCIFDGANDTNNGYISGSECTDYSNEKFINTPIALYSNDNYQKDYEVHFTIDRYVYNEQPDSQSTIFNDKLSSSVTGSPYNGKSPGVVVRKYSTSNSFEIKSTYTSTPVNGDRVVVKTPEQGGFGGTDVRILRIDGKIYTSVDNGPLELLQDMTNPAFAQQFGLTAWFGAYPDNANCTEGCTLAKRYFEGELSNMYIKLGNFDEDNLHEVTFNGNGGSSAVSHYLVLDGNSITTLPTATRTDWIFGGWWTAATGGEEITTPFTPTADTPLYAHWYKSVSEAQITNTSINLSVNGTETIQITNASGLEPYSFTSSHDSVATVDSSGVVTAVATGVATITMTGSKTGDIRTITVTVGTTIIVTFDPDYGSEATFTRNAADGGTMDSLPDYSRSGYELEGWYSGQNGTGTKLTTSTVFGGGTVTYYYAHWTEMVYVCRIATSLHSETCSKSNGNGCRKAGWASNASNTIIEYGHLVSKAEETHGAAYDCDVDYDGTYDSENERFYYFGTENGNAKFIHYKNMPDNSTDELNPSVVYNSAIALLPNYELDQQNPLVPVWDNPHLVTHTTGTYAGKAARFMTYPEITGGLWSGGNNHITPSDPVSTYLFEQSNFATNNATDGIWLEEQPSFKNRIQTNSLTLTHGSTTANAARATIDVPVEYVQPYYTPTLLDVTNAIIANNDLTVPVGGQITIQVSNSASLEPYTFSSDDTSIATVDSSTGVVTGVSVGTVDIIMTGTNSGLTKTLEVDVLSSLQDFTVTFNANGGTLDDGASTTRTVTDGDEVGVLPTASKTNHKFFGWYKDDGTFYEEVYADEAIEDNVTFYAKWVEDTSSLPIVWSEINACQFNGNAVISGDYCTQNKTKNMVDTGVSLFNTTNYQKDFEIGFTVVEYATSSQSESQATLVNSKYENSGVNYPGFVIRRNNNNFQLTSKWSNGAPTDRFTTAESLKTVKIVRQNGVLKYSFNGGNLTTYFDTSGNTHRFDTRVWFGAAATSDNETPQRYLKGTLTDMYVRIGVQNSYNVELNPNGGTLPSGTQTNFTITAGDPVGELPTPTAPSASYTFGGWYNGSTLVSDGTQYIPTSDVTLVAKWVYNSSDTPVVFNIANDALQGYQTLINGWVASPVNINTFNQASPINSSTWGDTTELSEKAFWEGIKGNFETNLCSITSYSDATKPLSELTAWGNGSVDCSKPKAYDTKIGAALNVYLNDENGEQVTYANATNGIIHNMIPGQTYYWEKADDSSVYGYVTATSVNGRRPIELSANRNTRDLGGLPVTYTDSNNQTVTGTTAYGKLFRGERLWNTPAVELYNLGINKQYDVGDPTEYANDTKLSDYKWDPVVHYNFDYNSGDENNASSNYMKAWTAVTDIMSDIVDANDPKNIYFHCRVGADRTGTTAYLLEGLLGVPDEARYEEYELTNLSGLYDRTRYYKQKTSTNNLKFVFMMEYVKTNADIVNWYMSNPNSDMNLVQAFRDAMTITN